MTAAVTIERLEYLADLVERRRNSVAGDHAVHFQLDQIDDIVTALRDYRRLREAPVAGSFVSKSLFDKATHHLKAITSNWKRGHDVRHCINDADIWLNSSGDLKVQP